MSRLDDVIREAMQRDAVALKVPYQKILAMAQRELDFDAERFALSFQDEFRNGNLSLEFPPETWD